MEVSLPAFAHRVTVFGSTRNIVATSAGVSSGSASGVRADMCTASPPGPVLRSCVSFLLTWRSVWSLPGCPIWPTDTILPSRPVTRRPPGAKFSSRLAQMCDRSASRCVILAIHKVAPGRNRKNFPGLGRPPPLPAESPVSGLDHPLVYVLHPATCVPQAMTLCNHTERDLSSRGRLREPEKSLKCWLDHTTGVNRPIVPEIG